MSMSNTPLQVAPDDAQTISLLLKDGKVGIVPTDTVYGLVCIPFIPEATREIYRIKNRPETMNLPVFVDSMDSMRAIGLQVNAAVEALFASPFVPGGLTMIVGVDKANCPEWLAHREEVAVRLPDSDMLRQVMAETGPLLCTSANAHGSKVDNRYFTEVMSELSHFSGFVVDGGDLTRINSTIVNCRTTPATIEREGAVSPAELAKYIQL